MNYSLAKEIYGLTPWCVDSISFPSLSAILKNIQKGVDLEVPDQKYNSISLMEVKGQTKLIQREWQLDSKDDFDAIGIINLNGPITKGGGASSSGMIELSNSMISMSKDSRVKGFIVLTDSGGGSSAAVNIMGDAIQEVKKTKPVYSLISKGGMAASAAYGIISNSNKIYAEDEMSIVGSNGTMIQFAGKPHGNVDRDGEKTIVLYASKSTEKNKDFEEAINNDNYELLISNLLDPVNESFINRTLQNRYQLKGTNFDNGHTKFAKDSIGTFIDGIANLNEVVQMVLNDSKNYNPSTNNSNLIIKNSVKMTREEIKSSHPTVYNEIVNEGINAERERVASWMVYANADTEAVTQGIESGAEISPSQREKLMVKMNSANMLANLQSDSPKPLVTNETPTSEVVEEEVNKELEEAFNFKL